MALNIWILRVFQGVTETEHQEGGEVGGGGRSEGYVPPLTLNQGLLYKRHFCIAQQKDHDPFLELNPEIK